MREIKFRGISKRTGKMVYGDFLRCSFSHGEGVAIKDTVNHVNDGYQDLIPEEIIQGTESQFTGLKDKNGTEIYEGDLVKQDITINTEFHGSYGVYEILFNNGGFLLSYVRSETGVKLPRGYTACFLNEIEDAPVKLMLWSKDPMELDQIEVIGNIYENHDLLKGES